MIRHRGLDTHQGGSVIRVRLCRRRRRRRRRVWATTGKRDAAVVTLASDALFTRRPDLAVGARLDVVQ
jgi:hypothetical protein